MFFRDIKGHTQIKRSLANMPAENRISHAYMFAGPEGSGKLPLAMAFARYLNCESPVDGDSCGECHSCKKYSKLVHPDLHFVFPVVDIKKDRIPVSDSYINEWREFVLMKKYFNLNQWFNYLGAERKQGMIYTKESNEIIKKLSLKTFEGKYKVMIIWLPEKMHLSASNKLLKLIEEPPAGTVFLLVSDKPDEVISTIVSRTQQIRIPPFTDEDITAELMEDGLEKEDAQSFARLAKGNIVTARDIVEGSEDLDFFFDNFVFLMRNAYSRKLQDLIEWGDEMSRLTREKQKNFFDYCLRVVRENYISNIKEPGLVYMTQRESDFSAKFAPFINDNNVHQMAEEFSLAHSHVVQNGNSRIIFMDLILKIIILIKNR